MTPGLQQANVSSRDALVTALRDALAPVAGRSRDITLIIPDASTRILLLDFDTLPEKPEDADAVVRFRLKKSLPFDVEASSVSFDRQPAENGVRVVAAVTPKSVLEEYESVVRDAGYNPGAVLPSMIAALGWWMARVRRWSSRWSRERRPSPLWTRTSCCCIARWKTAELR